MNTIESTQSSTIEYANPTLLTETDSTISGLINLGYENSTKYVPPLLVLGTFERVGSNRYMQTLGDRYQTHNEPFKQQLHRTHPISSMNMNLSVIDNLDPSSMNPFERYWLTTFILSKYSQQPQALKETNLFFSINNFVRLFPLSDTIVLTRDPIGIVSSFKDLNLYDRWEYEERYDQLLATTTQPPFMDYYELLSKNLKSDKLHKLVRLIALNSLLLASAIKNRHSLVVSYEDTLANNIVTNSNDGSQSISSLELEFSSNEVEDCTFSTKNVVDPLTVSICSEDVDIVRRETEDSLHLASLSLPDIDIEIASTYLSKRDYTLRTRHRSKPKASTNENVTIPDTPGIKFIYDLRTDMKWRNTLVTNAEFCDFLNRMRSVGLDNVLNGAQLLMNENMIHERGGRIHFNASDEIYNVSEGYENHPSYWVTWLGAAAFARYCGAALPTSDQLRRFTASFQSSNYTDININHRVGDVVPPGRFSSDQSGIYDKIGNLRVWCQDGPENIDRLCVKRFIFGVAWNSNSSDLDIDKLTTRPVTGSSRSIGMRLLSSSSIAMSPPNLALIFHEWFDLLQLNTTKKDYADSFIVDSLTY